MPNQELPSTAAVIHFVLGGAIVFGTMALGAYSHKKENERDEAVFTELKL